MLEFHLVALHHGRMCHCCFLYWYDQKPCAGGETSPLEKKLFVISILRIMSEFHRILFTVLLLINTVQIKYQSDFQPIFH